MKRRECKANAKNRKENQSNSAALCEKLSELSGKKN
jgi:hypothetical protein